MPGTEEKNQDDASQLLLHIRNTQLHLQDKIVVFPVNTPIKHLSDSFDKLIFENFLNKADDTFQSIESIDQTFKFMLENIQMESQLLGVSETYKPLCDGLQLIIQWYRIQAIEVFLQKPVASELAVLEDKSEDKVVLHERFDALIKKITHFNARLEETKQALQCYKIDVAEKNSTDLKEMLTWLMSEELRLDHSESDTLGKLKKQEQFLAKILNALNQELQQDILCCKLAFTQRREKRESLHPNLKLDVYYVQEFQAEYKDEFEAYKKSIWNKQHDKFLKIEAVEKLIENLAKPVREFELLLSQYYQNTSYLLHNVSANLSAINGIYELLHEQFATFKLKSTILKSELQYRELYQYKREGLPQVEKLVEDNFINAAKKFLNEVAQRPLLNKTRILNEADLAFSQEVEGEIRKIKPADPVPPIKPVDFKESRKDILNQKWRELFYHIFTQELQQIKQEFDLLSSGPSASNLILLKQIEGKLENKRKELNAMPEISRFTKAYEIVNEICIRLDNDPIMLAVKERIDHLENNIESSAPKNQEPEAEPKEPELPRDPWYTSLINKPWKRAICYGLLAFTLVACAFTVWGLIAEMSALTIATASLSAGGIGACLVAGAYYIGETCCRKRPTEVTHELNSVPLSHLTFGVGRPNLNRGQKHFPSEVCDIESVTSLPSPTSGSGLRMFSQGSIRQTIKKPDTTPHNPARNGFI